MIVKNEEANIRRALSWGKGLVCEQIVVDTGSTDRTADIAKEMGAKVFHYQWDDDFSAAKNYALEQATGNWIAFLDADEYFRTEDVPRLKKALTGVADNPEYRKISLIRCTMLHLDDDGKPFSTMQQDRIFQNLPDLRYQNRVHESLYHKKGKTLLRADLGMDIPILHTGYAGKVVEEKGKAKRNLAIIRDELAADPDNYNNWSYLGDVLLLEGSKNEAKDAYRKALRAPEGKLHPELALNAISNLIRFSVEDPAFGPDDWREIYTQYQEQEREHPDIEYWSGLYFYNRGNWKEAARHLELAFTILERLNTSFTLYITGILDKAYALLAHAYQKLGKKPEAVKNLALALKVNPYQELELTLLLSLFQEAGEDTRGIVKFLEQIYDMAKVKDKLFLICEAEKTGCPEVAEAIRSFLTPEETAWLESGGSEDQPDRDALQRRYPQVRCRTMADEHFLLLADRLDQMDSLDILEELKEKLKEWRRKNPELTAKLEAFYHENPYWGELKPDESVYAAFGNRISLWKEQKDSFLWLYENLADYRSKRVLTAILENWYSLSTEGLGQVKEMGYPYYDPDLLYLDNTMDVVDLRAGRGDYVRLLSEQLGDHYRKIFCCEDRPGMLPLLERRAKAYPRIQICQNLYPEAEDQTHVGLIRINAEAKTYRILQKYEELIEQNGPQLMAAPYYAYEDLIRIPIWLHEKYPKYRFYLRYFGEDLIPTDYILYAIPEKTGGICQDSSETRRNI